ncbi:MAG TPA: GGDEF domain-containing protein [Acidimicrobiales bacterium]|jgi:diguanylate cyclase (GGDEF)-like protein|nr:GGDEF domain-containing protein [Acidimicrobiales bacterium]
MEPEQRRQRVLREYVGCVAALAVFGCAGVFLSADGGRRGTWADVVAVVALSAITLWFPLLRTGSAGARTYHLVEAPLVAGLLLLDPQRAMVAFVAGLAIGWLIAQRSVLKTVFGIAEHTVAAAIAVLVVESSSRMGLPGAPEAYVPLALAAYFAANTLLVSTIFELAAMRRPGERFFVDLGPSAVVALVAGVTGAFIGVLGRQGSGGLLLATVPVVLLLAMSRAHANQGRSVELLQGVVGAVADTHAGMSRSQVEQAVCARVEQVLDCPAAEFRMAQPVWPEIGAVVDTGSGSCWLIAHPRPVEAFRPEETDLLGALAGVAGRALENAWLQEQLARQALHDPLTGAPNRRLVTRELTAALARARRDNTRVGVAFLDLTGFKGVNDRLGHDAGDELLRKVATRLAECVRAGDMVGRLGGDEFVLLLPMVDAAALAAASRRVLDAFARPFELNAATVDVRCNIGVALWPADGDTPDDLLRRADAAMYQAKREGGNTIAYAGQVTGTTTGAL